MVLANPAYEKAFCNYTRPQPAQQLFIPTFCLCLQPAEQLFNLPFAYRICTPTLRPSLLASWQPQVNVTKQKTR